jgi:hypothetical protein
MATKRAAEDLHLRADPLGDAAAAALVELGHDPTW